MNDLYNLFGVQKEQWPMSAADNVWGMSLPEYHPESLNYSPIPEDFYADENVSLPEITYTPVSEPVTLPETTYTPAYKPVTMPTLAFSYPTKPSFSSGSNNNPLDSVGNMLLGLKSKADKAQAYGYGLKTIAAAGEFFSKALIYSTGISNADDTYENAKQNSANQMLAIDNQVQYYKNQIADKFNTAMARNAMTMAAKGLRVTAGNLLEQTKDAAYDATQDIATLESNANLKKIALESEAKQADVARNLTKKLLTSDLVGSAAKLGLTVYGGMATGVYGKLFSAGTKSLNKTVYGG